MYRVCVLMTSFNGSKYISDQIQSVLNQKCVDVTLYLSDDGSTDPTPEIIKSYELSNSIKILSNQKKYGTAGKNFYSMIERVQFEHFDFVAFADQDDIWYSDKLLNSVLYMQQNVSCVGVSSCVDAFWQDGRKIFVNKASKQRKFDYFFEAAGPGCTYVFKSSFANEIKSLLKLRPWIYSTVFSHDWLVYALARKSGYSWHILPYSTLEYRQHSANETGVNFGISAFKTRLNKLRSGWYLDQVYAVAKAVGYEDDLKYFFTARGKPNVSFYLNLIDMRRRFCDAVLLGLFFKFKLAR